MPVLEVDNNIYYKISVSFCSINILLGLCIAVYHFKTAWKHKHFPSLWLSFILVICTFLFPVICIISFMDPFNSMKYCYFTRYVNVNIYGLFKCFLYLLLVFRLHESYGGTSLEYNTKTLILWGSVLVIWSIFNMIFQSITSSTTLDLHRIPKCQTIGSNEWYMSLAMLDLMSGVCNCYLFIKPLFKFKATDSMELKAIVIKQMILTLIAISTSIISIICISLFYFPQIFAGIDIIISTLSILLMYKWNEKIFVTICCCCCLKLPTEDENNLNKTESTNTDTNTITTITSNKGVQMVIHSNTPRLKDKKSLSLLDNDSEKSKNKV